MSLISQIFRRTISQSAPLKAASATSSGTATSGPPSSKHKTWKQLSLFVALPALGLAMANAVASVTAAEEHERPDFVPYEHLRIRTKRFPWGEGKKSLLHNAETNPLPDGYEEKE